MNKKIQLIKLALLCSVITLLLWACSKDSTPPPAPTVVKEWNVALSPKNEIPARAGRTETGTANIKLYSDNSIKYSIDVTSLAANDTLTAAHIHTVDVITNGPVILGFDPAFTGGTASGTITNIRSSFVDSLKNDANDLYFNVHSTKIPGGLIRGPMNTTMAMAEDIAMVGANEVPTAVATTATGLAILRMTTDKKLYSKVTVTNLEANDTLAAAHIHKAAVGVNGNVIVGLCASAADFGIAKSSTLADDVFAAVKNDPVYVNAHSTNHPAGFVRGQIR